MLTLLKYLIATLVAVLIGIATGARFLNIYGRPAQCVRSFNEFAYEGPPPRNSVYPAPPLFPWQAEEVDINELSGTLYDVALTRSVGENDELWIWYRDTSINEPELQWAVYEPQTQTWELISREIENTPFQVDELFITNAGDLWGRNDLAASPTPSEMEFIPALSKFNENTDRFETAEGVPETPTNDALYSNAGMQIILDHDDIFWIFVPGDAIYRYDPVSQTSQRMAELERQNTEITNTALAPDGSIYFEYYYWNGTGRLQDFSVYQFLPDTNEIERIDLPDEENWPVYGGLHFSLSGNLWLGATGYREPGGSWHLVNPNPPRTFDQLQTSPALFFESSNGVLWFNRWIDTGGWIDGAAWYDPATGEGCQFTNELIFSIVEDSHEQLWLVSEGILYRSPL